MKLPDSPSMREMSHGIGDRGMCFYQYQDKDGLQIFMEARREHRRAPFVEKWLSAWLPDREFATYKELAQVLAHLDEQDIEDEVRKWPQVGTLHRSEENPSGAMCWLHPQAPRTHMASALRSWIPWDRAIALICDECAQRAMFDPTIILAANAARTEAVRARRDNKTNEL